MTSATFLLAWAAGLLTGALWALVWTRRKVNRMGRAWLAAARARIAAIHAECPDAFLAACADEMRAVNDFCEELR